MTDTRHSGREARRGPFARRLGWMAGAAALAGAGGLVGADGPGRAAHLLGATLALLCAAAALLGIAYTLLAGALIGRFFSRPRAEPSGFPAVTLVKAMHGAEWALLRNLSSFCEQDYPGEVQYLFGVNDAGDPALKAVEELGRLHPKAQLCVVADSRLHGPNRKVSNIINMLPRARHDVLVFADSDVAVPRSYLREVVGELQKPGVGLVTCLYWGEPDPGFWPRLSAMATNYQFLPSVVIGLALGRARPCFGQTIAMRRETLEAIGGFEPFVNHLAEDHAIGEAVRALGGRVSIPPFVISHACAEASLARLVAHELRWSRTIRAIDPVGHMGCALIHPLAFALLCVPLSGFAGWSWTIAAAALLARLMLKLRSDRVLGRPGTDLWLLPLWDLVSFPVFVASYFSSRVTWRGFRFNVDANGLMSPVGSD